MMDSCASTSSRPYNRYRQTQSVAKRIVGTIRHHLLLLHRSESNFVVLGAMGNVYTVILSTTPSSTCHDTTEPCKHRQLVLVRVLGVSLEDTCLRRRTLGPAAVPAQPPTWHDYVAEVICRGDSSADIS